MSTRSMSISERVDYIISKVGKIKLNEKKTDYSSALHKAFEANDILTGKLYKEFFDLVGIGDHELVRKAVAVNCLGGFDTDTIMDFSKVEDSEILHEEIMALVIRAWVDHKHGEEWTYDPTQCFNGMIAKVALEDAQVGTKLEDHGLGIFTLKPLKEATSDKDWVKIDKNTIMRLRMHKAYEALYKYLYDVVRDQVELETHEIKLTGIDYKSLQSLFNKCYVRRGQTKQQVVSDMVRNTIVVSDIPTLKKVVAFFKEEFKNNFEAKVNDLESLNEVILKVNELDAFGNDSTEGKFIIPYRMKPNGSEKGKKDPLAYNLNFFYKNPWFQQSGEQSIICAFELQIGLESTINEMRENHRPYEKKRILDSLPLLKNVLNKDGVLNKDVSFSQNVDYEELNARLTCNEVEKDGIKLQLNNKEKRPLRWSRVKGNNVPLIINNTQMRDRSSKQILWEHPLESGKRYRIDSLKVLVHDQLGGNEGLMVGLLANLGDRSVVLCTRGFGHDERDKYKVTKDYFLNLAVDRYCISEFSFNVLVPKNAKSLAIFANGRITGDQGHYFVYYGHELTISSY